MSQHNAVTYCCFDHVPGIRSRMVSAYAKTAPADTRAEIKTTV